MHISISGQHIDTGNSLREYMEGRINEVILKYFEDIIKVDIHLDKEGNGYRCELEVHNGNEKNANFSSHGRGGDAESAFDEALLKTEVQLRKHKSKSKDHDRTKLSQLNLE